MRETIESVIIAFVLAFLFRTFEAEAFVIPTGSMAPTLMGKHKDVECPMCHYRYQANASDKPDGQNNNQPAMVVTTTCPMCRFTANVSNERDFPSYDGDRILVAKFPYEFADPQRWDVVVFRYPGDSTMNYIKRLVGLPGETIRIQNGDLWIQEKPGDDFKIARKPPVKILAMLQPVYDNDLAPTISGDLNWPARWTAEPGQGDYSWTEVKDLSCFGTQGSGQGEAWIRYRHRIPTGEQWGEALLASGNGVADKADRKKWADLLKSHMPPPESVVPRLISDFTAYNSSVINGLAPSPNGLHWVGDLAVQFELESHAASGKVIVELIKGGRHFDCVLHLDSGDAELTISGSEAEAQQFQPKAPTTVAAPGRHQIIFSNVDDQLRLWVDGSLVKFGDDQGTAKDTATTYDSVKLNDHIPTKEDLSPVGIGAKGAAVEVRHIIVKRDVYYIAELLRSKAFFRNILVVLRYYNAEFNQDQTLPLSGPRPLTDFKTWYPPDLARPENWKRDFSGGDRGNMRTVDITLKCRNPADPAKDQFFVLGDNSAQSADGRLWTGEYWVDRELFVGKALFIYWPHGWKDYLPFLPFNPEPNFPRMHLVR
jgi:signal peptidase I